MKKTKCPICGNLEVVIRRGTFRFTPPPNVPGGEILVPGSSWEECLSCNEQFLGSKIDKDLQKIKNERLQVARREKKTAIPTK